jgi:LysR family transcriptional regulator for metE and metH
MMEAVGAARELNVTPPAVTLQLKLLEQSMGMPLFERGKKGLRATEAGRVLIEATASVTAALEACSQTLELLRGVRHGRVAVGVVSTAKYFAPRALAEFAKQHPNVEIRLSVGNRKETLGALADLEIDIGITGYPPDSLIAERKVIGEHPHVIIAAPGHPMATGRRLRLGHLKSHPFIVREPDSGTRQLMERLLTKAGVSVPIRMEIDSNETIKQAVMAGLGIAFISAHTIAAELQARRLCVLRVEGLPVVRQWYAVRHRDKRVLPAGRAMWDFLVSESSRFLPEVEL